MASLVEYLYSEGGDKTVVHGLIRSNIQTKKTIRDKLFDGKDSIILPIKKSSSIPNTLGCIHDMDNSRSFERGDRTYFVKYYDVWMYVNFLRDEFGISSEELLENKHKSGMKLSRWLSKRPFTLIRVFNDRNVWDGSEGLAFTVGLTEITEWCRWFYEKLATFRDSRELVITTKAIHILGLSENSSYNSCIRFDGEYGASTTSYLQSSNVFAVIYRNKGQTRKIGRFLVYTDDKCENFSVMRKYGDFPYNADDTLISFLKNKLDDLESINSDFNYSFITDGGAPYIDDIRYQILSPEMAEEDDILYHSFPIPICICCGNENEESSIICENCRTRCDECGERGARSVDYYTEYGWITNCFCSDCHDNILQTCDHCDNTTNHVREVEIDGETQEVCARCFNGITVCRGCGKKLFYENTYIDRNIHRFCKHCLENGMVCNHCNTYQEKEYIATLTDSRVICISCRDFQRLEAIDMKIKHLSELKELHLYSTTNYQPENEYARTA